ncbi:hypothetical protein BDW74DRAFT_175670 [Aspergillus multicolor]|uniref:uncharacterized protein n=1 Tax=Aspergillus multicolor TaxID=41759 RepID=UPI003CCD3287
MKLSTLPTILPLGLGLFISIASAVKMAYVSGAIDIALNRCRNFDDPVAIAQVSEDSNDDDDFKCLFYARADCEGRDIGSVSGDQDENTENFDEEERAISVRCERD